MVLGVGGGVVLVVVALVVAALVFAQTDPQPDAEGVVPTPLATVVLLWAAGACVFWGFWRVMRLGRAAALARGEDPDAVPRLTWRTVISPRGLARFLFAARGSVVIDDAWVGRLGAIRGWIGLLVVLSVIAWFDVTALPGLVSGALISGWNLLVVSTVVLLLVAGVLYPLVPGAERRSAGRALLRPLGVLVLFWTLAGVVALLGASDLLVAGEIRSGAELVAQLVLLAVLVWVIVFAVLAGRYAGANGFRSGEAHPALPPLITLLVSWGFVALSALAPTGSLPFLAEELESPVPQDLDRLLSWCGVATVSALCVLEIVRLAGRGHRLPAGPWAAGSASGTGAASTSQEL